MKFEIVNVGEKKEEKTVKFCSEIDDVGDFLVSVLEEGRKMPLFFVRAVDMSLDRIPYQSNHLSCQHYVYSIQFRGPEERTILEKLGFKFDEDGKIKLGVVS